MSLYRFYPVPRRKGELRTQYVYGYKSSEELVLEEHRLGPADAHKVAAMASAASF